MKFVCTLSVCTVPRSSFFPPCPFFLCDCEFWNKNLCLLFFVICAILFTFHCTSFCFVYSLLSSTLLSYLFCQLYSHLSTTTNMLFRKVLLFRLYPTGNSQTGPSWGGAVWESDGDSLRRWPFWKAYWASLRSRTHTKAIPPHKFPSTMHGKGTDLLKELIVAQTGPGPWVGPLTLESSIEAKLSYVSEKTNGLPG